MVPITTKIAGIIGPPDIMFSIKIIMLVMVLADVAFVSAEMVFYDKKSDFSAGIHRYRTIKNNPEKS